MPPKEQSPLRNEENFDTQSKYSKKKNKDSEKYSAVRQFYKGLVGVVFLLVGYAVYYDM